MNKVVLKALRGVGTLQQVRHASEKFTVGPHLLTRPKPKMPKGYEKIERKREIFQRDDGIPTHLKGGTIDLILYRTTAFSVLSLNVWSIYTLFHLLTTT